jgi:alkanesulfonate monooxygenase SsuD/methylene tetrahydromethanopterin reductase-like flavin-dependent oxidoreductase (luciferase family)
MRRCWGGGEVSYSGEFFDFRHIKFEPVPAQTRLPIWVGGNSWPALRRAAKYADVWHPHDLTPDEVRAKGENLNEFADRAVPRSVRLAVDAYNVDRISDLVDAYVAVDCVRVVVDFRSLPPTEVSILAEKAANLLF